MHPVGVGKDGTPLPGLMLGLGLGVLRGFEGAPGHPLLTGWEGKQGRNFHLRGQGSPASAWEVLSTC